MQIECMSNDGFEDQLTSSTQYKVKEIGVNDYLIENDKSRDRWYGSARFEIKLPA